MVCKIIRPFGLFLSVLAFTLPTAPAGVAEQESRFFIQDGDRFVFYGDSITCHEWYPTLVETFVLTRFPAWHNEFHNRGVSGDNIGNLKRFSRDLAELKPQAYSFMMGYNDAGYRRLDADKLKKFLENVEASIKLARGANPQVRIMLISPTLSETAISDDLSWVSRNAYPYALYSFGRAEEKLAQRLGTQFTDMSTLYGQTMGLGYIMARQAFGLSRDGVHPQQEGQTFIAYHLLRGMGAVPVLAETVLDAAAGKVVEADRCQVSNVKLDQGKLSFTRLCQSLPYPTPEVARPFAFLVQIDDTLSFDRLQVRGLTAPSYALMIDDRKIAEVAAVSLEEGLNLSRFPQTPMYEQAMAVMAAVRAKQELETGFWGEFIMSDKADGTGQPKPDTDAATRAKMAAVQKAIAAARDECYRLNQPREHRFRLESLDKKLDPLAVYTDAEIAQAFLENVPPTVTVNWNTMTVDEPQQAALTITNPNAADHSGRISWNQSGGWKLVPAEIPFTVAAGKSLSQPFTITLEKGAAVLPVPLATIRSDFSRNWPFPVADTRELRLHPVLTINRAKTPVTVDGNLDDWTDATSFTLDDVYFITPPIRGKKALWNGSVDLSVTFSLKWDEQNLYLAAKVRDDEHQVKSGDPSSLWAQDALHLSAYLEDGKKAGWYEYAFGLMPTGEATAKYRSTPEADAASGAELQYRSQLDAKAGNCTYEVSIPWIRLPPFMPAAGRKFRFTFVIADADSRPGKGFTYLAWTAGINYGKNYKDFATIVLGK